MELPCSKPVMAPQCLQDKSRLTNKDTGPPGPGYAQLRSLTSFPKPVSHHVLIPEHIMHVHASFLRSCGFLSGTSSPMFLPLCLLPFILYYQFRPHLVPKPYDPPAPAPRSNSSHCYKLRAFLWPCISHRL